MHKGIRALLLGLVVVILTSVGIQSVSMQQIFVHAETTADQQCPEPDASSGYSPKNDPYPAKYTDAETGKEKTNLYGKKCTDDSNKELSVIGHCVTENKCHADKCLNSTGAEVACGTSGGQTGTQTSNTPGASPNVSDDKVTSEGIQQALQQGANNSDTNATGVQVAKNETGTVSDVGSVSNPGNQSALNSLGSSGPSGSAPNTTGGATAPSTPPPSGSGSSYSPAPSISNGSVSSINNQAALNELGSSGSSGGSSNPFQTSSGYSGGGSGGGDNPSYSATRPTFSSGGPTTPSYTTPTVPSNGSALTNFVSSIGDSSLSSIFGLISSIFAPGPSSQPVSTHGEQATQIVTQQNPVLEVLGQPLLPQNVTVSKTPPIKIPQVNQADYQSLLALLTAGNGISPSDIATFVDLQVASVTPATPLSVAQVGRNGSIKLALTNAINAQTPSSTSLALSVVNGLQSYKNIPEEFYIEEAALAQAQSDYQWLQAQIAAWERAKDAGVCDEACSKALAKLENEVPGQAQEVTRLQAAVDAGPFTSDATTSTTTMMQTTALSSHVVGAGEAMVISGEHSSLQTPVPASGAPFYVKQNDQWCDQYDQCIPAEAFASSPATTSTAYRQALITANTSAGASSQATKDPVSAMIDAVKGWIHSFVSFFVPNQPNADQQQQCSLFKSIFGGCGRGW